MIRPIAGALTVVGLLLGGCDAAGGGAPSAAAAACKLEGSWQGTTPAGPAVDFIIAPDGRMVWAQLGIGQGIATLDGRDLHIRFSAPADEFSVRAGLSDDCQSGEGVLEVQRARTGPTGTFPITLQAGRADAWRDHYLLSSPPEPGG